MPEILQGMPPIEAAFVAALFGIPMVLAVVIFAIITGRKHRANPRWRAILNLPPTNHMVIGVIFFIFALLYFWVMSDVDAGKDHTVNAIFALLYLFLGRNIPTIGFVLIGLFFLVLGLVRYIRGRRTRAYYTIR